MTNYTMANDGKARARWVIEAAGIAEQQTCGRERWDTRAVVLRDADMVDPDVKSHADWLVENQDFFKIRVIDKRSCSHG